MATGRYPNGRSGYAVKRALQEKDDYINSLEKRIKVLEDKMNVLLKDTKGSVANEVVKATVASTATAKKLIDFKLTELKALAEENGINDEGFTKKAEYVKALKEKDPTLE